MKYFLPVVGCLLIALPSWSQRDCRSFDYRQQQLRADPTLAVSVEAVEQFTRLQLRKSAVSVDGQGSGKDNLPAVITIPVVVHVLYNNSAQNISDAQILSQLDVLNADYGKHNADTSGIPAYYSSLAADCGFQFVLATVDTNGHATTGIIRKHTNAASFSINDDVKYSSKGGDDAWDRDRYLNLWVCNLTGSVLGYSSVPGGPKQTDGVVILYTAFGTKGSAAAPYNRGRTATHETGHWLNLIHVWGDTDCGDDEVSDTPPQKMATYGNPSGIIVSCGNTPYGNLYMDYMDFTDDIGMHLFTYGQRDRMRTMFVPGGFRHALLSSNAGPVSAGGSAGGITGEAGAGEALTIDMYPNPAMSTVTVKLNDMTRIGSLVEVYNQIGMRVMVMRITQTTFSLNLAGLSGGVYVVRVEGTERGTKLVKM